MYHSVNLKPAHGFFGGIKPSTNYEVVDDLGMEDGGLLVLTIANKRKQRF